MFRKFVLFSPLVYIINLCILKRAKALECYVNFKRLFLFYWYLITEHVIIVTGLLNSTQEGNYADEKTFNPDSADLISCRRSQHCRLRQECEEATSDNTFSTEDEVTADGAEDTENTEEAEDEVAPEGMYRSELTNEWSAKI